MPVLDLTADQVLSTTRSVRKRLDLTRPVEREVLEECLTLAQQAPTASNRQQWHFVVVTDPDTRAALGELYRQGSAAYLGSARSLRGYDRIRDSARFLVDHIERVPVHVIPCIEGRLEGASSQAQAATWGSILPGVWSFMLAARARGLGTCWTTFHLAAEREAARVLGIPYTSVTQAALIPVAYTIGVDFKPAPRSPLASMVHWNQWQHA